MLLRASCAQPMLASALTWIAIGTVVAVCARALYPADDAAGWLTTIGLGQLGGIVGGLLGAMAGGLIVAVPAVGSPPLMLAAGAAGCVIGSAAVVGLARRVARRRRQVLVIQPDGRSRWMREPYRRRGAARQGLPEPLSVEPRRRRDLGDARPHLGIEGTPARAGQQTGGPR